MQNPFPSSVAPPAAPKRKTGKWLALGCGLPVGLLVVFFIAGALLSPDTPSSSSGASASASKASLPRYAGKWQGADGTSLWIRADGKGDFDGGSTKVTGGGVTIDEKAKTLAITSFFGIGKTWKISQPPKSADSQQMTLDGMVFRRSGGFNTSSSGDQSTTASLADMPSPAACDKMARTTLTEFDRSLATRDFNRFYRYSAKAWQDQTSPAQLQSAFKGFTDKGLRLDRTLRELKPVYDKSRLRETSLSPSGMLELGGLYPSRSYRTYFQISYLKENETWRPASFHLKIGDPIR